MYLITGGAGFIGSHLAQELTRYQQAVRIFDNFASGQKESLDGLSHRVEIIDGDVRDLPSLRTALRGVRYVFHQASMRSGPWSLDDPSAANEVNVQGTLNVLVAARDAGVQRVVYASSSSVYGETPSTVQEEGQRPIPASPMAVSQLSGELYCRLFWRLYGLETVSLRYFNVFGPRQDGESDHAAVIPKFIVQSLRGEPVDVHGDGLQSRDFTYVSDVVQATLLAAKAPNAAGEIFNIGTGESHTVMEIVFFLSKSLGRDVQFRMTPPRKEDVRRTQADISRARRFLGYEVEVEFPVGLAHTVKYFTAKYGSAKPAGVAARGTSASSASATSVW